MISQLKQTIGLRMRPVEMNEINSSRYDEVPAKFDEFARKSDENDENEVRGRLDALTTREGLRGEKRERSFSCAIA